MLRYLAIAAQSLVLSVVYAVFVLAVRAALSSNVTGPKQTKTIGWQFSRRFARSATSQAVCLLPTRMAVCLPPGSCACAKSFEKLSPVVWRASTSPCHSNRAPC